MVFSLSSSLLNPMGDNWKFFFGGGRGRGEEVFVGHSLTPLSPTSERGFLFCNRNI